MFIQDSSSGNFTISPSGNFIIQVETNYNSGDGYDLVDIGTGGSGSCYYQASTLGTWSSPQLVAANETASTTSGTLVTLNLSAGAIGTPTSATVSSSPAHGTINAVFGTQVSYTPNPCFVGADTFQFTLANASGDVSNTATATITVTAPPPSTNVYLVSPFLLGQDFSNIDLTSLYNVQNFSAYQATGLMADNTSAAIAIFQTNSCNGDVTFTTSNSTQLFNFTSNSLSAAPGSASSSLTVPSTQLTNSGTLFYAAALVQAPPVGTSPAYATPIVVTAQQGVGQTVSASMSLVPPPVLLIHGLWGSASSLSDYYDTLVAAAPWANYPALPPLVTEVTYPGQLKFDSSSSLNSLDKTRALVLQNIWNQGVVGARVDAVAHSMGGLLVRSYSDAKRTNLPYRTNQNRQQGWFHTIVTLDTPEAGSNLAEYLLEHELDVRQATKTSDLSAYLFWGQVACRSNPKTITVAECLANNQMPVTTGAVASLVPFPPGPNGSLNESLKKAPAPNISDAIWYAITATNNSGAERYFLNRFIRATYVAEKEAPTLDKILGVPNDDIVPLSSQLAGNPSQYVTLPNLAHAAIVGVFSQSVLNSSKAESITVCWLRDPCQRRSKNQPAGRRKTRPVGGVIELGLPL